MRSTRCEQTSRIPRRPRSLEDDHARERVTGVGLSSAPSGQRQQGERDRDEADPGPLAAAEIEAEEALGEHREEDEASREHRLADRDRGKRERGDVQGERHRRDGPANAPPLRAKEIDRAAQRVAHVDIGSGDRSSVLEQESEVRSHGGQQRTNEPHADG